MLVKSVWIIIWTRTKEICRFFHWLRSAAVYKSHHVVPPVKHQRQYHQYTVGNLHASANVFCFKCGCDSTRKHQFKLYSLHRWHRIYKMYTWSSLERCISLDPSDPLDPLPCEQWHPSQMSWIHRRKIYSLETFDLQNTKWKKNIVFHHSKLVSIICHRSETANECQSN